MTKTKKEYNDKVKEIIAKGLVAYQLKNQGIPRQINIRGWESIKHQEDVQLIQHPKDAKKTRARSAGTSQKKKQDVKPAENQESKD